MEPPPYRIPLLQAIVQIITLLNAIFSCPYPHSLSLSSPVPPLISNALCNRFRMFIFFTTPAPFLCFSLSLRMGYMRCHRHSFGFKSSRPIPSTTVTHSSHRFPLFSHRGLYFPCVIPSAAPPSLNIFTSAVIAFLGLVLPLVWVQVLLDTPSSSDF